MASPTIEIPLDVQSFCSPPAEAGIMPFWFWNCDMDEARVRRQIRQMADAGCGGFFIHPRQGLTLPYLSDEWFARVRVAVEAACECGVLAWLYDEYPYPSGIAGGLLTANHPEFRARNLEQSTLDVTGGALLRHEFPLGRIVSALACPVDAGGVLWDEAIDIRDKFGVVLTREQFWLWPMGHIPYNEKRFMADEGRLVLSWKPPAGEWKIFVGIETELRGFKYYDCFFDPLCPGAAQEFLRITHERYAEHLGEFFGNTIPGIFTDETAPPDWSPCIEAELGLDLAASLPALQQDDHPRAREVRYRVRDCSLRLFHERWEKPIAEWCERHNLIWGAEKPTRRPAQFWAVAEPSTDAGHRRVGIPPEPLTADLRANHRAAMGAAEQSGTERVRCECFHSLGWGATLQDLKWQIDWLTVQGVNRITPHAFYATSSGLAKHDAAPSFFAENPYWEHFGLLSEYTARLGYAMSSGREAARIAVLHPTTALWSGGESAKWVREEYEWLMNLLLNEHHIFHPIDALVFERATATDGGVEIGHARYETLVVPPVPVVDEAFEIAIRAALRAGMRVLSAAEFAGVQHVRERNDWAAALNKHRRLSIADSEGNQVESFLAMWREASEQQLIFICNTSDDDKKAAVEIRADVVGWRQWFLESGKVENYAAEVSGGSSHLTVELPAYGSILLVGDKAPTRSTPDAVHASSIVTLPTDGSWQLKLDRLNALRLNRWRIACDGADWSQVEMNDEQLPETPALPLNYLDQTRRRWVTACEHDASTPVWYRRHLSCEFVPEDLCLLVEDTAILGEWTLFVNGIEVSAEAFTGYEYNGEDKSACALASLFHEGENLLALRVENAPEMGGLRTPLHLLGSFGVAGRARRVIVPLPETAPFNNLAGAGLPHYSGGAIYRRRISKSLLEAAAAIELPRGFQDIAEVKLDGEVLGVRAWSPYCWDLPRVAGEEMVLEIKVTNALLPFVEGQQWDAAAHKSRDV